MKARKIFFLMMSLVAISLSFVSCGSDDDDGGGNGGGSVTGISLNKTTLSVEEVASETLVATLTPAGSTGKIEWSSSAPSIASVNNGVVTGIKQGTATIAATYGSFTATCTVTVTQRGSISKDPSLDGSDYFVMILDDVSATKIEGKIAQDFRPDDVNKYLYYWDQEGALTFEPYSSTGVNFYEELGWTAMKVTNVGWSGAGFFVGPGFGEIDLTRVTKNIDDYYLHVAVKSAQTFSTYTFVLYDKKKSNGAKLVLGKDAVDGIAPYADFPRDNEWHAFDVPMSYFQNSQGLYYREPMTDENVLAILGGGVAGTTVEVDALFIYKPKK
ncbi:Ig-like domain-containing protein [Dysgonomonas sp. 520]|uniref:Ig-like domain-containing protein n=1 Tax=Dysgonomonas sp. 520 TaxID=2302931 RepID=UPI0013D3D5F1|nr:Ig-like domain-containing protein [Dysgonomonas sp. 520]NDW08728.1 Ig domain-containing protein [Dysgonomonas sp. 520]